MTTRSDGDVNVTGFALRGYRGGDLDAMFQLDVQCFEKPFRFSRAAMRRFAEAPGALVSIAEPEPAGSVAGFSIVQVERGLGGHVGYLVTLDVGAAWRRRGLGRLLLAAAERDTVEAGASAMELHVFTENVGAQTLYETCGYERTGLEPRFYGAGGSAFVYRKLLNVC